MRLQGKIKTWDDERGYGFAEQHGGGVKVFLHISNFSFRTNRPKEGDLVTFEVESGPKGLRAINVKQVGQHRVGSNKQSAFSFSLLFMGLPVVCVVFYILLIWMTHPNSTISASMYKAFVDRSALNAHLRFTCEGEKTSCSQMNSCAEAFFYQERCGVSTMDGDLNGIPCEKQWCN